MNPLWIYFRIALVVVCFKWIKEVVLRFSSDLDEVRHGTLHDRVVIVVIWLVTVWLVAGFVEGLVAGAHAIGNLP